MNQVFDPFQISRSGDGRIQITEVTHAGLTECYLCIAPPNDNGDIAQQIRAIYDRLFDTLHNIQATPHNLISQKLFFSDLANQYPIYQSIRTEAYNNRNFNESPATTCVQQPPAQSGRCVELQAHLIFPTGATEPVTIRPVENLPGLATGAVVEYQGLRHIHLRNLTGESSDFATQAATMFTAAETALQVQHASFHDVVRTWIYLSDLAGDYNAFNPVRTEFFNRIGLSRIPASTGIQGGAYPPDRACLMDVYALQADTSVRIAPMHAKTMNEATEYGSSFSRGITVTHSGQTTAYVSGTASINDLGEVVHIGDIKGQTHRMFQNVEALLDAQGASLNDVVSAITYLKQPEFFNTFTQVAQTCGLPPNAPHTITIADVCRPEWLCEIEVIAIFPERV